ncbi:MAG: type II toxin-antitoxin system VapC family toxin [Gammaproteobacteria bacterium]|nr:type II toxin-antitoxin system VapC family toxin [Gammaproteobacteria bacterium]
MRYMLDTNICIYLMNRRSSRVVERFAAADKNDVVLSVITLAELRHGVERLTQTKGAAERAVALLLTWVPAAPFYADAAVHYGVLAAAVRDRRRDALDRLIAAHALSLGVTLVTNNEADFTDYPGLLVENWVRA